MPRITTLTGLFICCICLSVHAEEVVPVKTSIAQRGKLLFSANFDKSEIPSQWKGLHGTQWSINQGSLKGIPSTKEYQASRTKHSGGTPSSKLHVTAKNCIAQMSFKLSDDLAGAHFGFNHGTTKQGTGHVCRATVSVKDGLKLVKDINTKLPNDEVETLAESKNWKPKKDVWYTIVFEVVEDQFAASIKDGPQLTVTHKRFNFPKTSINLPTRGGGTIYYDDVRVWEAITP